MTQPARTADTSSPALPGKGEAGRRGGYAAGRQKREALVESALEVFGANGFQRLSLRRIAEELGTSHAALSYHFADKEALLTAVLDRQAEVERPVFEAGLAERGLLDYLPEYIRDAHTRPAIVRLDVTLQAEAIRPDHPAHEWVVRRDAQVLQVATAELRREQQRGLVRADLAPEATARLLIAALRGLQIQWLHDPQLRVDEIFGDLLDHIKA